MSFIQIEQPRPHVTLVTLNRPERMNAMAFDVMVPLRDTLHEIGLDNDIRVASETAYFRAAGINNGLTSAELGISYLLEHCYEIAERIVGFSQIGVELTKQLLWASYDAGGLHSHMNHEGQAQLYVRLTTGNFEEKIAAWKEGRTPVYTDE